MDGMVGERRAALITGVTGQDGSYLAELLLRRGYEVHGITRDPATIFPLNLQHLAGRVSLIYCGYEFHDLVEIVRRVRPTEIYNLAGQSYVGKSWEMVEETFKSVAVIPSRLLEAILANDRSIRFLQASSSELFNPGDGDRLAETFPISPYNPYGCSKTFAHCMVSAYRRAHGIFAVSAILFPHESPRRHPNFAFKKIVRAAVEIKSGGKHKLQLGNLHVLRDWGYAPEYVSAMHRMMLADEPDDYCLCTGATRSLQEVVQGAFEHLQLDWQEHVEIVPRLTRLYEPKSIVGDGTKAAKRLGWEPASRFEDTLKRVMEFEIRMSSGQEKDYGNERPGYD
jgi:GDPmannose 4,6-dehydratase